MKNSCCILALLFFQASVAFSQSTFYSCDSREVCYWNDKTQVFEDCTKNDENSRFKINKGFTMFEHTTADISSAYYVSKFEHDNVNDVDVYDVTSDVGNKYTYIFDTKYSEIRIVGTSSDGGSYLVRFHIKATWTED